MSSEIIDFYRKANANKLAKAVGNTSDAPQIIEESTTNSPKQSNLTDAEPLGKFFLNLAETLKQQKVSKRT